MKKLILITLAFCFLFVATTALAGGTLSAKLAQYQINNSTRVGLSLYGPTSAYVTGTMTNNNMEITLDSSAIPTGRYVIVMYGFDKNGQSTFYSCAESRLSSGDNVINFEIVANTYFQATIDLGTIVSANTATVKIIYTNGNSSWGDYQIVTDDTSSSISAWIPSRVERIEITIGSTKYTISNPLNQLADNNGTLMPTSAQQMASITQANIYIPNKEIYPIDFQGKSLAQAITDQSDDRTIKLQPQFFYMGDDVNVTKNVTVEGDSSFGAQIAGPIKITGDKTITFKNIIFINWNSDSVITKGNNKVVLDHCIVVPYKGNAAISGASEGLRMYHCTFFCSADTPTTYAFDFNLSDVDLGGIMNNCVITGFSNLYNPASPGAGSFLMQGDSNLIWNVGEVNLADNLTNTVTDNPGFSLCGPYNLSPNINSSAADNANDGTYIGAVVPQICN